MRRLVQPQVVAYAALGAAGSAALSLPRLLLWDKRPLPLWYLEANIFLGGFVLWAFVFAWHTAYAHRPVFTLKIKPTLFVAATLLSLVAAAVLHWLDDPLMRRVVPEDFPSDFQHWLASILFTLAFTQLLLVYSPFAWLVRLFRNPQIATALTIGFGIFVMVLHSHAMPQRPPVSLLVETMLLKIGIEFFEIWFYLRGGMLLVWWMGLLVESRHLLTFFNL